MARHRHRFLAAIFVLGLAVFLLLDYVEAAIMAARIPGGSTILVLQYGFRVQPPPGAIVVERPGLAELLGILWAAAWKNLTIIYVGHAYSVGDGVSLALGSAEKATWMTRLRHILPLIQGVAVIAVYEQHGLRDERLGVDLSAVKPPAPGTQLILVTCWPRGADKALHHLASRGAEICYTGYNITTQVLETMPLTALLASMKCTSHYSGVETIPTDGAKNKSANP